MGFFDDRLKQFRQKAPMMGTLGGPGYGEFPLGSAGPRVDPRDPNYRPPPRPSGGNPNPFNNPLFSDPGLGGEGGRGGDRQVISPPQFPDGKRRGPQLPPTIPIVRPPSSGGPQLPPTIPIVRPPSSGGGFFDRLEPKLPPRLPPTIPIFQPINPWQKERGPVNGGINPVVGKRPDGSDIRLFDQDNPNRQGPGQIPPTDPSGPGDVILDGPFMPPMRTMDFQDANNNGIDDRDEVTGGPAPMPGGPVRIPQPRTQFPGGGVLEDIFGRRPPKLPPMRPPEGGGSDEGLFGNQNKAGYDRILSNLYQDQYRNQGSPYAAQADYLMNRPVFDRGVRTDNPMFTFQKKDDPFATMSSQQYIRDEADAAALANQQAAQAEQERIAAEEAAAEQAAADAKTAEEAAIAAAEQERVAAEKAAAEAATIAEADRIAAEMAAEQEAAAAAAAQQAAAAEAAAAQQAAEAESQRLAEEAEAQRMADVQARIDAMESRFGGFEGRFGGFDPAAVQERIAAAQEAARAAAEEAAANSAVVSNIDPDIQERINALQGEFGRFGNFDPAAIQASIAAAQEAAANNAAAIENTPAVDPDLQARIDAMQNEVGGLGRRFEGFDPRNVQANIAAARQAAEDARAKAAANEAAVAAVPEFDASDIQARIAELGGRFGNLGERVNRISEREIPQFDASSINQRIDALANREIPQFDDSAIQARIAELGGRFGTLGDRVNKISEREIPQFDDSAIQSRIDALANREIPQFDDSAIQARIDALANREIPQFDASDIQARIRDLGGRVNQISEREIPRFDDSAIRQQIEDLRSTIPTGIPAAEVPPMLPGTGTVPGVKINTDTLPGNLTGIGDGRATPLPSRPVKPLPSVKGPAPIKMQPIKPPRPVRPTPRPSPTQPPTRTIMPIKTPPPPKRTTTPIKRAPIKTAPTPIKRAPIKTAPTPIKRAPIKRTPIKRAPIKPVKSAPPKKTTTKRPAPRGRVTDKRTRRGRGR